MAPNVAGRVHFSDQAHQGFRQQVDQNNVKPMRNRFYLTPNRASLSLKCCPEIAKTLILLCPATFGKTRRQRFPNYPCLTNLVLVAEIAGRKRLGSSRRKTSDNRLSGSLVLLALGHAVDVRLVQRVNLIGILRLLGQDPAVKAEILSLFFSEGCGQLSLQLAD